MKTTLFGMLLLSYQAFAGASTTSPVPVPVPTARLHCIDQTRQAVITVSEKHGSAFIGGSEIIRQLQAKNVLKMQKIDLKTASAADVLKIGGITLHVGHGIGQGDVSTNGLKRGLSITPDYRKLADALKGPATSESFILTFMNRAEFRLQFLGERASTEIEVSDRAAIVRLVNWSGRVLAEETFQNCESAVLNQ